MSVLIPLALAVSSLPYAVAHDNVVLFQAGETSPPAIDQKSQSIGVDYCAGEVAPIDPPTGTDATSKVVRMRSDGIINWAVAHLKAGLVTSGSHSPDLVGGQSLTKGHQAGQAESVQRAIVFEEDRNDPRGKSYSGFVSWHTETARANQRTDVQRAIQAEADVPDQAFNFVLCMWPDSSQSLTPSHSISVIFAPTSGTPHGGISEIAGITVKRQLASRGVALSGVVMKVAENSFRLALSGTELARQRNLKLLKDEDWINVLIRYNDRLRALIALEKSPEVSAALSTWK